jgi:transcriptional regulator with XRE-family HTH domain
MPHRAFEPLRIPDDFWHRDEVIGALRRRDIGGLFRLIKRHTGASQTQLGIATGLEQGYVSRIMSGRRVLVIDVLERIADGYAMPDPARAAMGLAGRYMSYAPAIAAPGSHRDSDLPASVSWREGVTNVVEFWRGDVERRDVLRSAAFSAAGYTLPALRWFTSGGGAPLARNGDRAVGQPDVDTVREMTTTFRRLDNQYGGGHVRESVVRYLDREVAPLLGDGRFTATTGRALFSAAAEATQLAGWCAYDTGEHGIAQQYLIHALDLARAAGDDCLGAEILAAMSHQATYLRNATAAFDLAQAAGRTAQRAGVPVLVAEAAVMEAHAHARRRDGRACAASLATAEQALDRADRSRDPQWIAYFDEAYMSAKFGHCFRELGEAKQAERFAARSLHMDGRYVRGRAFNLALLATAHAQQGEPERACAVGAEALTLAVELKSARATDYVRQLQSQLAPHAKAPTVRRFNAHVNATLGGRAQARSSPR